MYLERRAAPGLGCSRDDPDMYLECRAAAELGCSQDDPDMYLERRAEAGLGCGLANSDVYLKRRAADELGCGLANSDVYLERRAEAGLGCSRAVRCASSSQGLASRCARPRRSSNPCACDTAPSGTVPRPRTQARKSWHSGNRALSIPHWRAPQHSSGTLSINKQHSSGTL